MVEFRVEGLGLRAECSGCRVKGLNGLGLMASGLRGLWVLR